MLLSFEESFCSIEDCQSTIPIPCVTKTKKPNKTKPLKHRTCFGNCQCSLNVDVSKTKYEKHLLNKLICLVFWQSLWITVVKSAVTEIRKCAAKWTWQRKILGFKMSACHWQQNCISPNAVSSTLSSHHIEEHIISTVRIDSSHLRNQVTCLAGSGCKCSKHRLHLCIQHMPHFSAHSLDCKEAETYSIASI